MYILLVDDFANNSVGLLEGCKKRLQTYLILLNSFRSLGFLLTYDLNFVLI
jgi:hypothetical protein